MSKLSHLGENRIETLRSRAMGVRKAEKEQTQEEKAFLGKFALESVQKKNLQISVSTRNFTITIDEPPASGGDDIAPSPVEVLLAAFAGCLHVNWVIYLSFAKIEVEHLKVKMESGLDMRYVLTTPEYPPRLKNVKIITEIKSDASMKKLEHVLEKVKRTCPVGGSLHPDITREYIIKKI